MPVKNANMIPSPNSEAKNGNALAITAANIQWVKLPSDWPDARTSFGNISEIKTQMTVPCDKAKKPM